MKLTTHLRTLVAACGATLSAVVLLASAVPAPAQTAPDYTAQFWPVAAGTAPPAIPAGAATLTRPYTNIDLNWGTGGPGGGIESEHFVARFTKTVPFAAGVHRFTVRADDGVRVYIDGQRIIDRWFNQPAPAVSVDRYVAAGSRNIRVEYYERTGTARVHFSYKPAAYAGRGMWVWERDNVLNDTLRNRLLNHASTHNIDRLYVGSGLLLRDNPEKLADFIAAASARGIEVELLLANHKWAYAGNHQQALDELNRAKAFADNPALGIKPAGVHFDVEPHTLPEWDPDDNLPATQNLANQYIDLLGILNANKGSLRLSADLQFGYKSIPLPRGTTTKEVAKWAMDKVDRGVVMAYRDFAADGTNGIIDHAQFYVQYGASLGKPVTVAVETICGVGNHVTFCEESKAYMAQELLKVTDHFRSSGGFGGIAIHDYAGHTALRP